MDPRKKHKTCSIITKKIINKQKNWNYKKQKRNWLSNKIVFNNTTANVTSTLNTNLTILNNIINILITIDFCNMI